MNPFPTLALLAALPAALLAQSPIESTFRGGLVISNPAPAAATMYFDIDVLSPTGIIIDRFDINTNAPTGTTGTFAVYVTAVGGTANGFQTNAAAWTLVNTQQVTSAGNGTQVLLTNPVPLAFGRYGIAMHHVSLNPVYTNPNTAPVLPLTFTNADLTLDFTFARSRTSLTTDPFGGTAAGNSPRMANVRVHYTTASVSADFTATPTRGASPLTVQFRSRAASSNPGGITAYVWDFDGDGVPDGSGANPTWIYTNCGNYTVSMTVIDSVAPTQVTKTNFIQTDIVVPSFSYALVAPNTLQFTDTSSPTPTTWDWDLDGDGVTDSTLQNPVFAYPTFPPFGEVNVRLTAGRACQPTATTQRFLAISNSLQTAFGGGLVIAATSTGGANFVDVNVTNPQGISVSSMHINSAVPVGSPVTVDVYVAQGGYTGKQADINQWRQVANVVATSRGTNGRTFVQFQPTIYLPAGTHGLCIRQTGASPVYSNLGQVVTVTNSDLSVTGGLTMAEPVFATGTQYNPRMWNGVINYSTCSLTSDAGYGFFAAGCAGASGVPGNGASSLPRLGNAMNVTFTNLPVNAAIVALGFSRTASAFGPLPLDLTAFGAPGCFGNVSPDATNLIVGTSGRANWTLTIPASASLLCTQFYSQAFVADPVANLLGFVTSDAAAAIIGQ